MTTYEAIYMLRETKKLVLRKEKMKKNVKRPYGCIVPPNATLMKQLPATEPDYGVIRQKPYTFYSSVFGFEMALKALNINIT
jgi:abnormal spindle-like microcephaly-associated protein